MCYFLRVLVVLCFFFKQKTAYEMRISDWSSDVCSSDLKYLYAIFIVNFLVLGYLGTQAPNPTFNLMSQIGTVIYLGFFFLMPVWSRLGTFKQVPEDRKSDV